MKPTLDLNAGWPLFGFKVLLAALWLGAILLGAHLGERGAPLSYLGAALIAAPALIWLAALNRQARIDEREAQLAQASLAQGAWWAIAYGAAMYAIGLAGGWQPPAVMLAILPVGAFVFGESMAQLARAGFGHRSPDRGGQA